MENEKVNKHEEILDLVIIGAAAAGSSAAVYAARRNLNFVVVSKDIGGEVALSGTVENWIGIESITGFELAQNFAKHVKSYGVQIDEGWGVEKIEKQDDGLIKLFCKNIVGEERVYTTKTVIISSGIHPRELGVPGEKELKGMGVTYCTVCDGPLFKNKVTATIGAGNSALESALMLSELVEKAYVLTKYPKSNKSGFPKGEDILVKKLEAKENVEILYEAITTEILGDNMVSSLKYNQGGEEKELETNGVMVHIGMIPNSYFVDCAEKNKPGEIKVNQRCETSCEGVFAAGDVTDVPFKQISIAAGQGTTAALSAIDYLNHFEG